jgi:hypothetical protein
MPSASTARPALGAQTAAIAAINRGVRGSPPRMARLNAGRLAALHPLHRTYGSRTAASCPDEGPLDGGAPPPSAHAHTQAPCSETRHSPWTSSASRPDGLIVALPPPRAAGPEPAIRVTRASTRRRLSGQVRGPVKHAATVRDATGGKRGHHGALAYGEAQPDPAPMQFGGRKGIRLKCGCHFSRRDGARSAPSR